MDESTTNQLLGALREATGRVDLDYAARPVPLAGGFYAEMLRFRLANPPPELDRDLVARIVPDSAVGAWESTIQGAVAGQGFPTPQVRLIAEASNPLGRYLIVMDAVDGQMPMADLGIRGIVGQIPKLVHRLPDQLAKVAADLHALDPQLLGEQLDALGSTISATTAGFVTAQAAQARELGRQDIAAAAERLLRTEPISDVKVITHGDLHPFNLLLTEDGPVLIDWTVARIAHPGFTLGFTDLMLSHPPITASKFGSALLRPVGHKIARRFLDTYRKLTDGTPAAVDEVNLAWHRKVHALRILVELAGWDAYGTWPSAGHPWFILEPVANRQLGIRPAAPRVRFAPRGPED